MTAGMKGIFVTGTDTNVGKTVAAAAILHRYRTSGSLRYWKPIQTGIEVDNDTDRVRLLGGCTDDEVFNHGFRLKGAVAPYLAAPRNDVHVSVAGVQEYLSPSVSWIVEGAGGVLVPLNDSEFMLDLMVGLSLPVLVVTRASLGTINHTLLTLEAVRHRNMQVAGVLMIGERNADNRSAIERYGSVPVLGEMPPLSPLTQETLKEWAVLNLDADNILARYLR
jgi:dethiobiotin synthase